MKIIKTNGFYYLSYSFRKKGNVVNRKKYVGMEIPVNIEEIKQTFLEQCFKEEVFGRLKQIKKRYAEEWKKLPESIKKERLVDFSIDFTYNTNAIEGSSLTKEDTESILKRKIAPARPYRDIQETIHHSKVFFTILQEKKGLSEKLLLEWHKSLFSETKSDIAGVYREYLVRVGEYRAPDWQDVTKLMKELFLFYEKNKKTMHPVELAALMHYEFEKIHPFGDGNGRVGRLIINYILYKNKYPMFSILYKKRQAYYQALGKKRLDFLQYFTRVYVSSYKEYLEKL